MPHCQLHHPAEQHAVASGGAPVESEQEFVEVRFPRFGGHPVIEVKEVFTWPKRR
jgi:hypothetical protein